VFLSALFIKKIKNLCYRYFNRRIYRRNFSLLLSYNVDYEESLPNISREYKSLAMPKDPIIKSEFLSNLLNCSKSGTWQPRLLKGDNFTSKYMPYFNYDVINQTFRAPIGGVSQSINTIQILSFTNVTLSAAVTANNLNMFNFRIKKSNWTRKTSQIENVSQAFCLLVGGANSFQHFVGDCLPILFFLKENKLLNKYYPILLFKPLELHDKIYQIISTYFSELEFLWVDPGSRIKIDNLRMLKFKPRNYLFSLPYKIGSGDLMKTSLRLPTPHKELFESGRNGNRYLTYLDRGDTITRKFAQPDLFEKMLIDLANELSLEYLRFIPGEESLDEIIYTLQNSMIAIGIHGGSMYNSVWVNERAKVFELVPTINTNSVATLLTDLGISYSPICLPFNLHAEFINLTSIDLHRIKEKVLSTVF